MAVEPVVKLDKLTVRYGNLTAVDGLSMELHKGGVYALLGRNGSGKSSTVRCLLGQQRPASGNARILGFDAWKKRRRAMERTGVVPENPDVPRDTTPARLERFLARVTPFWRSASYSGRLEKFAIPRKQKFARLSKGQQRQLALTIALAGSPRLLVLDDPTLGLDAVARRKLYEELVAELADRGTTVFLTTHDLHGVEGIADQIGILKDGSLLVDEKLDVLKARYCRLIWSGSGDVAPQRIEAGLQHLGVVSTGPQEAVVADFSEFGFDRFRQEAPVEVSRVDSLSLEEIFVVLCGQDRGGAS